LKPWERLGEATTPDGAPLLLKRHDTEYVIYVNGQSLMTNRMHGSEDALATLACADLRRAEAPSVLIGGLGMGFTLRAALDLLPASATVVVSELMPAVVEWNRGPLGPLAGHPLEDPRVSLDLRDVRATIGASTGRFDAVLLDVDHSPGDFFTSANAALYGNTGLFAVRTALKFGGLLAVWSVDDARAARTFVQRLQFSGFSVTVERVPAHAGQRGPKHTIFLARSGQA
jgi:spermidine synthase